MKPIDSLSDDEWLELAGGTASVSRMEGGRRDNYRVMVRTGGDEVVLPPVNVGLQRDAIGP